MIRKYYLLLLGKWNTFKRHFRKHTHRRIQILHHRLFRKPARRLTYDTFYHCCTQKTASQWIKRILEDPLVYQYTGLQSWPYISIGLRMAKNIRPLPEGTFGTHYYVDYHTFESIKKPANTRAFFMLRDPRDIVVSWYFSARYSHPFISVIPEMRIQLEKMDFKTGLKYIIDKVESFGTFEAQLSWLDAGNESEQIKIFRYEDLADNSSVFMRNLFRFLEIDIPESELISLAEKYSFESINRGRKQGAEDIYKHDRKGMPGDWRNYFDEDIDSYFRKKTGNLIELLGYE